jgi:hypothetical protein
MAQIKKLSTELQVKDKLLDTSGDAGTSGQILSSTGTGTNWINAATFSGGTVANATTFSSAVTFNNDIIGNGHIYGRAVNNQSSRLYRFGGLYLTWDSDSYGTNDSHSLRSTYGNTFTDSITLNSYNHIRFNIDSNDNNSTSYFEVGDGATDTSNVIFRLDQAGDVTITGDTTAAGDVTIADNKALMLGTGGDAFFKHTGSAFSFFNDTGHVTFTQRVTDGDIIFKSDNGLGGETTYFYLDGGRSDGTNLATRFPDGSIILLGSGTGWNDGSQIYHNGTNFYLNEYVGNMNFTVHADDGDIIFKSDNGSGGTENYIQIDGSEGRTLFNKTVRLNDGVQAQFGNDADLQIYHTGSNAFFDNGTGGLYIRQQVANNDVYFQADRGDGNLANYFYLSGVNTNNSDTLGATIFPDKSKIFMGDSKDLEIYHDGNNSFIKDVGTGVLSLQGNIVVIENTNGANMLLGVAGAQAQLYYNGVSKLETTSAGATVTGDLSVTGDLNITGDINSVSVTDLDVVDKTITVGKGQSESSSDGSGILVDGSGASILWDEPNNEWEVNKDLSIYTGAGLATLIVGRNPNERLIIDQTDNETVLTADNDSDGNSEHNFRLNRTFEGSGANNFKIQKGGTDQLTIDTNANAIFAGSLDVNGTSSDIAFVGGSMNFEDSNDYIRITKASASAQLGLFRSGNNAGGMYIGGAGDGFRIYTEGFSSKFHLDQSGNGTFSGTISTTGIVSTLRDSVLISYSGNDGNGNDAGLKIMNDGNDWGAYIRKTSNGNYGLRIDSGGNNALSIYSTTGGSTKTFGVNGSNGDTTIAGALSVGGTLSPSQLQVTSDNAFYRHYVLSATGGESWNASNGWHRIIEITGGSGRGRCRFLIQTNGGSGTPCRVEGVVNTAWSNSNATLSIIHNSYPNFITDIRVVRNSTSNKSFIDIKGGGEDYVEVTILPDGVVSANVVNFTNVNTLPSGDTMEIHQTLTNMIMSLSSGQGSGNGYDGVAGTGQKPFQVKYEGSIYAEQGNFANNVTVSGGNLSITGDGSNAVTFTESGAGLMTIAAPDDIILDAESDITLDANGADIYLKRGGTHYATLRHNNTGLNIQTTESNASMYLSPNGTGNVYASTDTLIISADEGEAAKFLLRADQGDDDGDDWYMINQTDNDLEFTCDKTGSQLANLTLTPQGPSNSAVATFAGNVVAGNRFQAADGSAGAPTITNTGDTNTGIYWPSDHQLGFTVNGSRKMYMSETGTFFQNQANGVEINNKLKLNSNGTANSTGAYFELHHENNNSTDVCATINLTNNAGGYAAIVGGTTGANNTGYIEFKTDNAGTQGTVLTLNGDNSATFAGSLSAGACSFGTLNITDDIYHVGDTNTYFGFGDGADTFQIVTAGTDALTINSSQDATFAGNIVFGDNHFIGNGSGDDLSIQSSTGEDIYLDSAGDITLDAAGNDIRLFKDGVEYGKFKQYNSGVGLYVSIENKDFFVLGNDGGTTITAFGLDMGDGGKATFSSTVRAALGNKGEPSYSFTGDTNTGMFSDSADTLEFAAGGASMLHVNVNAGKVGVVGNLTVASNIEDRNIPCLFNSNFEDAYGTSIVVVPFNNNTENNVSTRTYNHNLTMPYAGKLTKIVMKHVSGSLSSGFTTQLFLYVNGSQQASSSEISLSSSSVTWTPTTNNTFSAGDVLSFAYQKSAIKTFGGVSFGVAIELTDYDI